MKSCWVLNAALSMNKSQRAAPSGACWAQLWGQRARSENHPPSAGHGQEAALTLPARNWDPLVSTQRDTGRRSECSFKIRGFFSSVLMESTGQTHRLQVNELSQKPAQGDRSLRSEIQDRKSINRLFKVNGILLCVTLNGALNLYAV